MPVTEDTDLEALALLQNKRFWKIIDDAMVAALTTDGVDEYLVFFHLQIETTDNIGQGD